MGSSQSSYYGISEETIKDYEELTYLSRSEIMQLIKTYALIDREQYERNPNVRYNFEKILETFPQIQNNPFKDRIYMVFSQDHDGHFSLENLIDLYSVMSERCPNDIKAAWIFQIFDFDGDNFIGENDILTVIDRITCGYHNEIKENSIEIEKKQEIAKLILKEMDIEGKGAISQMAFEHGAGKMSEFAHAYTFRA